MFAHKYLMQLSCSKQLVPDAAGHHVLNQPPIANVAYYMRGGRMDRICYDRLLLVVITLYWVISIVFTLRYISL
jgi:hypothetical protein